MAGSTAVSGSQRHQYAFQEDVTVFRGSGRNRTLMDGDLAILRNYLQTVDADQALGLQGREQSGLPAMEGDQDPSVGAPLSDIYGGLEPLVHLNAPTPYDLRDDAHPAPALDLAGPSVRAPSPDIHGGLESLVDLNGPTAHDLRDDAQSAPALEPRPTVVVCQGPSPDIYGGLESLVDLNARTAHELRDDADSAPPWTPPNRP
ncbi:hypothetical protein [Bradyrhizobium algeriense]|uniref:hypothetical protein n=1 Tax=Bradyrhizobium algeriense TaxID=634784 RepID=UPI0011AE98A8|nr:hypothetical protein [Bradyrhizobium algeriense]